MLDLAVIGAGPCGLAMGVAAKRAALGATIFDKGPLVASLVKYPLHMTFFSTPEKLEIGEVPFVTAGDKPTRREALTYYRKVAEYFELDVRPYHEVLAIRRHPQGFEVTAQHVHRVEPEVVLARHVVCASGYLDHPNLLEVPGEDLAHVLHFFAAGFDANRIFIENGRTHGALICDHIKAKPPRVAPGG